MAELAQQAAVLKETGDRKQARVRLDAVKRIAARAAQAVPASAREMQMVADGYETGVMTIDSAGDAASKKLKAKAFDAVRAPVAGW
jgi:hypothetical protein